MAWIASTKRGQCEVGVSLALIPSKDPPQRLFGAWHQSQRPATELPLGACNRRCHFHYTFVGRADISAAQSLYLFLMPAILIAGIVGGLGPGLLSTFLCLALHLYATGEYRNLTDSAFSVFRGRMVTRCHFRSSGRWHRLVRRTAPQSPGCRRRKHARYDGTRSPSSIDSRHHTGRHGRDR